MEFRVTQTTIKGYWEVYSPQKLEIIIRFEDTAIGFAMAHDYCDFLNDKYCDKEINAEWPGVDRKKRIEYHLEEIKKLVNEDMLGWNEHGDGVK